MQSYHDLIELFAKYPNGAHVKVLAKEMGLTVVQVRARIGTARANGKNIQNVGRNTFQLKTGKYRSRRQSPLSP